MRSRRPYLLLILTAGLLASAGCTSSSSPQPAGRQTEAESASATKLEYSAPVVPPPPSQAYVGSTACAECHAEIAESYKQHPMGRSLAHVEHAPPLEDYTEHNEFEVPPPPRSPSVLSYRIERENGGVLHHEIAREKSGEILYDFAVPVHYAVGSGRRGRSYLINRDGLLFMSPVTWYSGSGRWDFSPGYALKNLHFGRRIVDGCVNCHAGRVADVDDAVNRFHSQPFLEEAIGCERCHGPGEAHVEHWRDGGEQGTDPIVNPVDLSPKLRDHVCFQCHLIGEHRLTRFGRSEFDFRPGDDLTDIWTIFLKGTGVESDRTTAAVSQVEQMLSSACYVESGGKLGCVSCHDPHSVPAPSEQIAHFRSKCLQCHGSEGTGCAQPLAKRLEVTSDDSCINCHMPSVAANDVPHTSQTDHRILRDPAAQEPPTSAAKPNTLHIFGEREGNIPGPELDRAQALYLIRMAEDSGNTVFAAEAIPILEAWIDVAPADNEAREALGTGYWLLRETNRAAAVLERGLEIQPRHENLLRRMMVLHQETNQPQLGVTFGERLIDVNPWDYEYYGRLAHMFGQLGRLDEAVRAGERALELNPAEQRIHAWLAEIHALRGDMQRSRYHRQKFDAQASP